MDFFTYKSSVTVCEKIECCTTCIMDLDLKQQSITCDRN